MSKTCEITGKKVMFGNNVSKSLNRTKIIVHNVNKGSQTKGSDFIFFISKKDKISYLNLI